MGIAAITIRSIPILASKIIVSARIGKNIMMAINAFIMNDSSTQNVILDDPVVGFTRLLVSSMLEYIVTSGHTNDLDVSSMLDRVVHVFTQ
jgi:hypothetical protein